MFCQDIQTQDTPANSSLTLFYTVLVFLRSEDEDSEFIFTTLKGLQNIILYLWQFLFQILIYFFSCGPTSRMQNSKTIIEYNTTQVIIILQWFIYSY